MRTAITLLLAALALGACGEKKKSHTEQAAEIIGKSGGKSDLKVGDRFLEVPPFKLLERAGVPVSNETLKGKVWVATFIFTTCKTSCIPMCSQMYHLQEEFKDEPDFVCVATTVDPANDTPEVLRSFAKSYSARDGKWFFLTGDKKDLYHLASRSASSRTRGSRSPGRRRSRSSIPRSSSSWTATAGSAAGSTAPTGTAWPS